MSSFTNNLPDARATSNFEVVRGLTSTAYRMHYTLADRNAGVDVYPATVACGEPLRFIEGEEEIFNVNDATIDGTVSGHVVGVNNLTGKTTWIDHPAGIAFDAYDRTGVTGNPSANINNADTVLKGRFIARVTLADWFAPAGKIFRIATGNVNLLYDGTPKIGEDVVIVNYVSAAGLAGVCRYAALYTDPAARYATPAVPTGPEMAVDRAVVGKIVSINATDAEIEFSF